MKKVIFTALEDKVLKSLVSNLYAERHFSDLSPSDISKDTNVSRKSLRGVLASLVRKKVIFIADDDNFVHLEKAFFYLHPTWKNE